jgi:hypothetical protein
MFILVCIQTFIKIDWEAADLHQFRDLQDGSVSCLSEMPQSVASAFFRFSMFFLSCVPIFITVGWQKGDKQQLKALRNGSEGCLGNWLPVFRFCVDWTQRFLVGLCLKIHQAQAVIDWKLAVRWLSSWRRWPSWKMTAHSRVCVFRTQHNFLRLCTKFHQSQMISSWIPELQWF